MSEFYDISAWQVRKGHVYTLSVHLNQVWNATEKRHSGGNIRYAADSGSRNA